MHRVTRKTVALAAVTALAGGALAAPLTGVASAAKSYKVTWTLKGSLQGTSKVVGKVTGSKPLGKGTYKGTVDYPAATYTMKFKGGTITFSEVGSLSGSIAKGKWKIKKGTGKFKGVKGSGTSAGDITKQSAGFKYKGTIKY